MKNAQLDSICGAQSESKLFTARAIERLEKDDPGHYVFHKDGWRTATIEYLIHVKRLFWDDKRGLFWVYHPVGGMQVATFLMDEALKIEPAGGDELFIQIRR